MAQSVSKITINHEEIVTWAKNHKAIPVKVKNTGSDKDAGILRFDFPGGAGKDKLEELTWDEWFSKFEANKLALLYQEHKKSGEDSTFFKLVHRENRV